MKSPHHRLFGASVALIGTALLATACATPVPAGAPRSGADSVDAPVPRVTVTYDGAQVLNGSTVTWTTGTKNLVVTVKKGNAVKVYTVAVTKS